MEFIAESRKQYIKEHYEKCLPLIDSLYPDGDLLRSNVDVLDVIELGDLKKVLASLSEKNFFYNNYYLSMVYDYLVKREVEKIDDFFVDILHARPITDTTEISIFLSNLYEGNVGVIERYRDILPDLLVETNSFNREKLNYGYTLSFDLNLIKEKYYYKHDSIFCNVAREIGQITDAIKNKYNLELNIQHGDDNLLVFYMSQEPIDCETVHLLYQKYFSFRKHNVERMQSAFAWLERNLLDDDLPPTVKSEKYKL